MVETRIVHDTMINSPTVRLAYASVGAHSTPDAGAGEPGILVSYYYLKHFREDRADFPFRDWVMDSGAFSAHASGVNINIRDFVDVCGDLLDNDTKLTEVFALDVIGDHAKSLRNAEYMWSCGIPAIPCYHAGEPWDYLMHIARYYPKIAIGGVARKGEDVKWAFAEECFARVWPKKIHGFGMASPTLIYGFPFHSVDSTSWEMGPMAFGNWQKFGKMDVRAKQCAGGKVDLRSQIKYFLEVERRARVRWKKEMIQLEELEQNI